MLLKYLEMCDASTYVLLPLWVVLVDGELVIYKPVVPRTLKFAG
jgi:hypothetical protein